MGERDEAKVCFSQAARGSGLGICDHMETMWGGYGESGQCGEVATIYFSPSILLPGPSPDSQCSVGYKAFLRAYGDRR